MATNETKVGDVFVGKSSFGSVTLAFGKGRGSRSKHVSAIDAKRIAYALLLAADEVTYPKSKVRESMPSAASE